MWYFMVSKLIFILTVLTFSQLTAGGQSNNNSFGFYYSFIGLGSNMFKMKPTIRIDSVKLVYTQEQNTYGRIYGLEIETKKTDTIYITTIRQSSIDSILALIQDLKDSTIYKTNPCIMSGGMHYLRISVNNDTTCFELHNTFHRTALKISEIINQYLPQDKHIRATEQDIINCENCWEAMRKH